MGCDSRPSSVRALASVWSSAHSCVPLVRSRSALLAENLFLRKQLAFYQERQVRPRRLTDAARISLVLWSKLCDWRSALVIVKPETLVGWHRRGFKLFWKLKSRAGRPRLPKNIRQLIARMVEENPTWGQARVADELALKLGILVSPRTVRAYWPKQPTAEAPHRSTGDASFAITPRSLLACDFLVVVTAGFRQLYVFVLMEIGTRRIVHCNVTAHPTAAWTLQQFREGLPSDHGHRFLIHDRDSIFSASLDEELKSSFGLRVLRTPVRAPQANAYCERLIGTMRREFPRLCYSAWRETPSQFTERVGRPLQSIAPTFEPWSWNPGALEPGAAPE